MNNILVIAPHADDETIGCGASIFKLANQGRNVYVLIATNAHIGAPELFSSDGIKRVRNDALKSHKILGVKETFFLDFPAPALDTYPIYKMANSILEIIRKQNIDTVFIPFRGDIHIDHQRVYDSALVACRPKGQYSVKTILCYETLSETEWASPIPTSGFLPNFYISVTEEEMEKKLAAFSCYESEKKAFPDSRSLQAISALAQYRGATISQLRAEAFFLVRNII